MNGCAILRINNRLRPGRSLDSATPPWADTRNLNHLNRRGSTLWRPLVSVDLRTDEIPSTGGHRFFAPFSTEEEPLALPPGVPNPGMTSVGCQFRGFCVTPGSEIGRHIRNLDRSLAKTADQRKNIFIVRRESDQVEADVRTSTVDTDHDVHHGDIQAG